MKYIFFSLYFLSFKALSLVALEGSILGPVDHSIQYDPFKTILEKVEIEPHSLRFKNLKDGFYFKNKCESIGASRYSSEATKSSAIITFAANLQYYGLDLVVKNIAKYAQVLHVEKNDYESLVHNLVQNYCSKNISVYSLKLIEKNLFYYFNNENKTALPSLSEKQFSKELSVFSDSKDTRTREFYFALENFKSLCSWGGEENLRLLPPYLSNPFIASTIIKKLSDSKDSLKVLCKNEICRNESSDKFFSNFPHALGASDLKSELESLYCQELSHLSYKPQDNEVITSWIKEKSLEEPILEGSFFYSLISQTSDLMFLTNNFKELRAFLLKPTMEKGATWAKNLSSKQFFEMYYEEPMVLKLSNLSQEKIDEGNFSFDFNYSLGEFDKNLPTKDALKFSMNIDVPLNYLRYFKTELHLRKNKSMHSEYEDLKKELASFFDLKLEEKKAYFLNPLIVEGMGGLMAEELLRQLENYVGLKLAKISNENIRLPLNFSIGIFALQYQYYKFQNRHRVKSLTFNKK